MKPTESIFVTSLRAFFKTISVFLAIILVFIAFTGLSTFSKNMIAPHLAKVRLTLIPDKDGNIPTNYNNLPVILNIDIDDIIGSQRINKINIDSILTSSTGLFKGRIKGLIINMNSRGGCVFNSDDIYRSIRKFKQYHKIPAYTFVDGICASGGYYIACATDKIHTTPPSIIGSVGVLLNPAFNFSQLMDRYGIKSHYFNAGKNKQPLPAFKDWGSKDEIEHQTENTQAILDGMYTIFKKVVTEARSKISENDINNKYGAGIFIAETAKKYGYIDEDNSDYYSCLQALQKEIAPEDQLQQQYAVINVQVDTNFADKLMQVKSFLTSFISKNEHQPFEYMMETM